MTSTIIRKTKYEDDDIVTQLGKLVKNYGLALIIASLVIRAISIPITRKTAMQSELLAKAKPELDRIEKKFEGKNDSESMFKKSQEISMVYKKYDISPASGCIYAFLQLPIFIAFLEAINRTPAIFEKNFLVFQMGTTPWVGITSGNYWYILLLVLIIGTTFFSFRKTLKDQTGPTAGTMKYTIYFMLAMVSVASLTLPAALGIYWISSSLFTILQNIYVERKKK